MLCNQGYRIAWAFNFNIVAYRTVGMVDQTRLHKYANFKDEKIIVVNAQYRVSHINIGNYT